MFLDDSQDYDVGTSQVGIFTIQIGLAALLRRARRGTAMRWSVIRWARSPAAYIAGGLPLEDAVRVICARSRLMGEGEQMLSVTTMCAMMALSSTAPRSRAACSGLPGRRGRGVRGADATR